MKSKHIRYAVVGLGHIAQSAVLPAFKHSSNSKLVALVSGSSKKLKQIAKTYKIKNVYSYSDYHDLLTSGEAGMKDIYDTVSVIMRFPQQRLASFVASFSAAPTAKYQIVGSRGELIVNNGYEYEEEIEHILTIGNKSKRRVFKRRDQFAAELIYFSDCILKNREPEPSATEGLADIRIIEAIYSSIQQKRAIALPPFSKGYYPTLSQELHLPPHKQAKLVDVQDPMDHSKEKQAA